MSTMQHLNAVVATARRWVEESSRIVVLTGAGISTDSGIPDFRGPQGVWTETPKAEQLSNIHYYMADPKVRKLAWLSRLEHPAWRAVPNAGHSALVELERRGKLLAVVTQNIDGLHQRAGNAADVVVEVHGTVHDVMCMACGWRGPMREALERVRAGERGGRRPNCGVGTSLQVYPIAGSCRSRKNAGARAIIVNAEPTPMDDLADAVIHGPIGEILPPICATEWAGGKSGKAGSSRPKRVSAPGSRDPCDRA